MVAITISCLSFRTGIDAYDSVRVIRLYLVAESFAQIPERHVGHRYCRYVSLGIVMARSFFLILLVIPYDLL